MPRGDARDTIERDARNIRSESQRRAAQAWSESTPSRKYWLDTIPQLSLPEFVERWKASTLTKRSAAHTHFIDLCQVLGQPHPAAADQTGDAYTFEKHVSTLDDGNGFTDVWKKGFFGWEYKGIRAFMLPTPNSSAIR